MKGIEWIKLATFMCEDEKMRLIDAMEERDPAHYVWIRLLLQAGKVNDNGLIYLKENVPYTNEMLSILFNRPVSIIKRCLEILESFELIKIYENNVIKICNWEKHQNIEGMKKVRENTRNRVREHREKKKLEVKTCNTNVTLQTEKREKENKNKKKNLDKETREENKINDAACPMETEITPISDLDIEAEEVSKLSEEGGEVKSEGQALMLKKAFEETKVNIKGLTLSWIKGALSAHKEGYIKMAINIAIEKNKLDIYYISGILKNWLKEGYPKTYEEMEFGSFKSDNSSPLKEKPKLRFNNFEARHYDYEDLEKKLLGWKE